MKNTDEFKEAVLEKRAAKAARTRKMRTRALLCVPLAAVLVLAGVFGPKLLQYGRGVPTAETPGGGTSSGASELREPSAAPGNSRPSAGGSGNIPLALQVGSPAKAKRVTYDYYQALQSQYTEEEWFALSQESRDEVQVQYQQAVTENQRFTEAFQSALNGFAKDSTALLAKSFGENDCYCPISLYYALALTGAGARNDTQQEFRNVLKAENMDWTADQCARYYRQHSMQEQQCTFLLANSLWMDGRCQFSDGYIQTAENDFFSSLFQADFADPNLAKEMTKWISANTGGLLNPEFTTNPDQLLAVINTVYFQARWGQEFSSNIKKDVFTKADGTQVTAEYMHISDRSARACRGDNFTRASRSLFGGYEMVFVLPDEGVDPKSLLQDPEAFEDMFYPLSEEDGYTARVNWTVPKFSIDSEFDLSKMLKKMGLASAFEESGADFSGMVDELPPEYENLYLSKASQGVHIGVDEEGVEAAAYTEIYMAGASSFAPPEKEIDMVLDRPFLFAIVSLDETAERQVQYSGSILFVGVCGDPTK